MALASSDGWLFLLRWIHFLSGITWIGILYYFNFVQTPFFAETDPPVRSGAIQKLVPRALWWFRWAAMVTFLSGWIYLLHRMGQFGGVREFFATSYGWAIFLGGTLGSFMWLNVWFVIWPKQKIVIQNAIDTAGGKPANPAAAAAGGRAGVASRTNVLFSIPMLFFMGAASHLNLVETLSPGRKVAMAVISAVIILLIEANALYATAGKGSAKPLATVSGTLWAGFILAAVFYVL
ncbi:MAG: urate hydroxylase PuuD, partial [Candidatus Rokubacteria bacterium]|nr:urate hydroxylase PuuD [Candidatus Rokubacteria bacterium]